MIIQNSKFKIQNYCHFAFTMIELIIVIIIIGILASTAISFFPNRTLSNDTNYLSLQIKTAQRNAIDYDHYHFGDILWKKRDYSKEYNLTCVDLNITGQRNAYGISNLDIVENSKNLTKYYHISRQVTVITTGLNDINQSLCFDNEGRPYTAEQKLLDKIINIKLKLKGQNKTILVLPVSGYVIINSDK